jgi:uncharacterized protein (TIGR03437 family)
MVLRLLSCFLLLSVTGAFSAADDTKRPPTFTKESVVNGISFEKGKIAPGSILSIFGDNLSGSGQDCNPHDDPSRTGETLPYEACGTKVTGSLPYPLLFVSSKQINAQVPFEARKIDEELCVETPGGKSCVKIKLSLTAPGLRETIWRREGDAWVPLSPGTAVKLGDTLRVFGTGFGASRPKPTTGAASPVKSKNLKSTVSLLPADSKSKSVPCRFLESFKERDEIGIDYVTFALPNKIPTVKSGMTKQFLLQIRSRSRMVSNKIPLSISSK